MCMSKDVAMQMVNQSIKLAQDNNDEAYYITPIKLHKLLYLGQCYMLSIRKKELFKEEIEAHQCGPYVLGIQSVINEKGFSEYRSPFRDGQYFPISYDRQDAINVILGIFGRYSDNDLVFITRGTKPYTDNCQDVQSTKPVIAKKAMAEMENEFIFFKKYGFVGA